MANGNIQDKLAQVGSQKGIQNPNDPRVVGTYKDEVDAASPEAKSVLKDFPLQPQPNPFTSMR